MDQNNTFGRKEKRRELPDMPVYGDSNAHNLDGALRNAKAFAEWVGDDRLATVLHNEVASHREKYTPTRAQSKLDNYYINTLRQKNTAFEAYLQGYQHRMNAPKSKQDFDGVGEFHDEIESAFETWYDEQFD